MSRFIALDVETANSRLSSICQIGMVIYEDNVPVYEWSSFINPETEFEKFNSMIHGIEAHHVQDAPTIKDAFPLIRKIIGDSAVASYGAFDRSALNQACTKNNLQDAPNKWINILRVVRNSFPLDITSDGCGLSKICEKIGVPIKNHHDALCDARAAGDVFVVAQMLTETQPNDWVDEYFIGDSGKIQNPSSFHKKHNKLSTKDLSVNTNGPLHGEVIVFTGTLTMQRSTAAERAAAIGCKATNSVSKKTTLLVVGEQDLALVGGSGKSTKQIRAEELIEEGHTIRIINEDTFDALLKEHGF